MIKEYTNDQLLGYMQDLIVVSPYATGVTAFVIHHNFKEISSKIQEYLDIRNSIIEKYGEPNPAIGGYTIVDEDKLEEANNELSPYADLKVSVDIIKLPESKVVDSNLTSGQLNKIEWMITRSSAADIRSVLGIIDVDEEDAKLEEESDNSYDPKSPITDDRFV